MNESVSIICSSDYTIIFIVSIVYALKLCTCIKKNAIIILQIRIENFFNLPVVIFLPQLFFTASSRTSTNVQ